MNPSLKPTPINFVRTRVNWVWLKLPSVTTEVVSITYHECIPSDYTLYCPLLSSLDQSTVSHEHLQYQPGLDHLNNKFGHRQTLNFS